MPEDLQRLFQGPQKVSEEQMTGEFKELIEKLHEKLQRENEKVSKQTLTPF